MLELARVLLTLGLAAGSAGEPVMEVVHHRLHSEQTGGDLEILLWVSEAALNVPRPPEDLPEGWWSVVARHGAGLRREASRSSPASGGCLPLPSPDPTVHGPSEEEGVPVVDYLAFAASSELVVVAEILAVEPGAMIFGEGGIGQRVRASVSEVLRDDAGHLSPGLEVTFFAHGGHLRLGHEVVCGVQEPDRPVPETGATVALTAGPPEEAQTLINPNTVFLVDRGEVRLPPDSSFKNDDVSLEKLRLAVSLGPEDGGQPTAPDGQHLLWADPDRRHPLFLPYSMLQETPIDQLPMDIVHQQILQSALDGAPHVGESTRCSDQGKRLCTRASRFLGVDRPVPDPGETVRVQGRLDLVNTGVIQHIRGGLVPRGEA